jgi:uncharacterized membrane protein (DUF485 family)
MINELEIQREQINAMMRGKRLRKQFILSIIILLLYYIGITFMAYDVSSGIVPINSATSTVITIALLIGVFGAPFIIFGYLESLLDSISYCKIVIRNGQMETNK